ncbi:hypothetical protein HDV00_008632, partial [Rhizophlyctis rosea]
MDSLQEEPASADLTLNWKKYMVSNVPAHLCTLTKHDGSPSELLRDSRKGLAAEKVKPIDMFCKMFDDSVMTYLMTVSNLNEQRKRQQLFPDTDTDEDEAVA